MPKFSRPVLLIVISVAVAVFGFIFIRAVSRYAIMALDITAFKVISAEPNPFTPLNPPFDKVTFSFTNPDKEDVILRVFDITGTQFYIKEYTSGEVSVTWDGKDVNGTVGEDGVYVYQVQVGTQFYSGTVILAK